MTTFVDRLKEGRPLMGLWQALACPYSADICARLGFDWLLFDGEHSPNTAQTLLGQLQAVAPHKVEPIARVPSGDPVVIKQYLDLGFRTILVPMVDSAAQATAVVAATRYPPRGIRGVASATSRAANFGLDPGYFGSADEGLTVIVQIESATALVNVEAIAAVDGVDALFIGPGDLAASLGHLGAPTHPEVSQAIATAKAAITRSGKPVGIFGLSVEDVRMRAAEGFAFISAGTDVGLLVKGGTALLASIAGKA